MDFNTEFVFCYQYLAVIRSFNLYCHLLLFMGREKYYSGGIRKIRMRHLKLSQILSSSVARGKSERMFSQVMTDE